MAKPVVLAGLGDFIPVLWSYWVMAQLILIPRLYEDNCSLLFTSNRTLQLRKTVLNQRRSHLPSLLMVYPDQQQNRSISTLEAPEIVLYLVSNDGRPGTTLRLGIPLVNDNAREKTWPPGVLRGMDDTAIPSSRRRTSPPSHNTSLTA